MNELVVVAASLFAGAGAISACSRLKSSFASRIAERQRREQLIEALSAAVVKMNDVNGDSNKLLAGTIRACETIAEAAVGMRDAVAEFGGMLHPKAPSYPEDALIHPPTDAEARIVGDTFAGILQGLGSDEARALAIAEEEKKTMLSAVSLGPED